MYKHSLFTTSSPTFISCLLVIAIQTGLRWYHFGFNLHFPNNWWYRAPFHVTYQPSVCLLCKNVYSDPLPIFLIVFFFLSSCINSLYFWILTPPSAMWYFLPFYRLVVFSFCWWLSLLSRSFFNVMWSDFFFFCIFHHQDQYQVDYPSCFLLEVLCFLLEVLFHVLCSTLIIHFDSFCVWCKREWPSFILLLVFQFP